MAKQRMVLDGETVRLSSGAQFAGASIHISLLGLPSEYVPILIERRNGDRVNLLSEVDLAAHRIRKQTDRIAELEGYVSALNDKLEEAVRYQQEWGAMVSLQLKHLRERAMLSSASSSGACCAPSDSPPAARPRRASFPAQSRAGQ